MQNMLGFFFPFCFGFVFVFKSGFCISHKLLIDAFIQLQLLQYPFICRAQASKAALPCCTVPTREATTTMLPAIGKTRKNHGDRRLLPRLMCPWVPLSKFCVLGVFCVSIHPQPRCSRALFSGMVFPLSFTQGRRQNALEGRGSNICVSWS